MTNLQNYTALITGASSGIGKACAEQLAALKVNLILTARRIEKIEKLSKELTIKYGIEIYVAKLDVRKHSNVMTFVSDLPEKFRIVDILINNAGLGLGFEKLQEGDPEKWDTMIDTNVKGLLYVSKEIIPLMAKRNSGHIINIGSTAGHEVYMNGNVYCATKFAVKAITKALRMELLDKYIRVTTVDPGMVETEFSIVRFSGDKDRAKNVYKGITPLTASDVADAVIYALTRPKHVNIAEIILTPSAQASSSIVHREKTE